MILSGGIKPTHAGYCHVTFDPPAKKPERFEDGMVSRNKKKKKQEKYKNINNNVFNKQICVKPNY